MKIAMLLVGIFLSGQAFAHEEMPSSQNMPIIEDGEVMSDWTGDEGMMEIFTTGNSGAPVWGPFMANMKKCAPGCTPNVVSLYRKGAGTSCHNYGRAVDVGSITCGGKKHTALANARFATFVRCMKTKMKVLYRNKDPRVYGKTQAHYDHGHFSIGCILKNGRRYWEKGPQEM